MRGAHIKVLTSFIILSQSQVLDNELTLLGSPGTVSLGPPPAPPPPPSSPPPGASLPDMGTTVTLEVGVGVSGSTRWQQLRRNHEVASLYGQCVTNPDNPDYL